MTETHDVIAAFADGERVSAEVLQDALSQPEGRAYLVDLLVLRDLVDVSAIAPSSDVPARSAAHRRGRGWVGIAAGLVIAALAGYAAGQRTADTDRAPVPTAVVEATAPSDPASPGPVVAPAPTRVITLQPGVDWQEQVGG